MHVNFGHLLVIWVILENFDQILVSFWCFTREFRSFPPDLE